MFCRRKKNRRCQSTITTNHWHVYICVIRYAICPNQNVSIKLNEPNGNRQQHQHILDTVKRNRKRLDRIHFFKNLIVPFFSMFGLQNGLLKEKIAVFAEMMRDHLNLGLNTCFCVFVMCQNGQIVNRFSWKLNLDRPNHQPKLINAEATTKNSAYILKHEKITRLNKYLIYCALLACSLVSSFLMRK